MANGQYSFQGNTISEEQLIRIAESKGMSLNELLELKPEIEVTTKPLSQQEVTDARFNIGGKDFDLGNISRVAEKQGLSVEEFFTKHKDKIKLAKSRRGNSAKEIERLEKK